MENNDTPPEIREYVQNHREDLAHVLKFGTEETVRGLALAVLLRGGDERDRELVKQEIDRISKEELD